MTGAYPKAIQAVMRHSTITLTMDTYGHLFPGQEAETIARFPNMFSEEPEAMWATGTDDAVARSAAHAQQSGRDLVPDDATGYEDEEPAPRNGTSPNPLRVAGLCEDVRDNAKRRARDSNGFRKRQ